MSVRIERKGSLADADSRVQDRLRLARPPHGKVDPAREVVRMGLDVVAPAPRPVPRRIHALLVLCLARLAHVGLDLERVERDESRVAAPSRCPVEAVALCESVGERVGRGDGGGGCLGRGSEVCEVCEGRGVGVGHLASPLEPYASWMSGSS